MCGSSESSRIESGTDDPIGLLRVGLLFGLLRRNGLVREKLNGLCRRKFIVKLSMTYDFYERRLVALNSVSRQVFVNFRKSFSDFENYF